MWFACDCTGDNIYTSSDIGDIKIIVNDKEVVEKLKKAGFNPVNRKHVKIRRTILLSAELDNKILSVADKKGMNYSDVVVDILKKSFRI